MFRSLLNPSHKPHRPSTNALSVLKFRMKKSYRGTAAPRSRGTAAPRPRGTAAPRPRGTAAPRPRGTAAPRPLSYTYKLEHYVLNLESVFEWGIFCRIKLN